MSENNFEKRIDAQISRTENLVSQIENDDPQTKNVVETLKITDENFAEKVRAAENFETLRETAKSIFEELKVIESEILKEKKLENLSDENYGFVEQIRGFCDFLKLNFFIRESTQDFINLAKKIEAKSSNAMILEVVFHRSDLEFLDGKDFRASFETSVGTKFLDISNSELREIFTDENLEVFSWVFAFGAGESKNWEDYLARFDGAKISSTVESAVESGRVRFFKEGVEGEEKVGNEEINLSQLFQKIKKNEKEFHKISRKQFEIGNQISKKFVENLISQSSDLQISIDEDKNTFYDSENIKYEISYSTIGTEAITINIHVYDNPGDTDYSCIDFSERYDEMRKNNPFENILHRLKSKIAKKQRFKKYRNSQN